MHGPTGNYRIPGVGEVAEQYNEVLQSVSWVGGHWTPLSNSKGQTETGLHGCRVRFDACFKHLAAGGLKFAEKLQDWYRTNSTRGGGSFSITENGEVSQAPLRSYN